MRRVVLIAAAALACTAPHSAHASTFLQCTDGFHQLRGKAGSNPPVSATVARQDDGRWSVVYVLSNGQTVMRENQYDISDKGNGVGWTGWRNGKQMRASIEHYNGRLIYAEAVYDGGEKLVGSNYIDCGPAPSNEPDYAPSAPSAPVVASTPAYVPAARYTPQAASQVVVPFNSDSTGRAQSVNVTLGSTPISMLIDSGCNTMAISPTFADQLVAQGEATVKGPMTLVLAGGQEHTGRALVIHRVQIGERTLTNVLANDGGADDSMLLGQSVLSRFGKFSIDLSASQLVLG